MQENRRNLFVSTKVRYFFLFYVIFSVIVVAVFLGWEVFAELLKTSLPESLGWMGMAKGFPVIVKVLLLLLWGMLSFLLSYIYLDAKFLGIFYRMDDIFKKMIEDDSLLLQFRKGDQFGNLADSFNSMRGMFSERISKRKEMLEALRSKIKDLPKDVKSAEVQALIKEIDEELSR